MTPHAIITELCRDSYPSQKKEKLADALKLDPNDLIEYSKEKTITLPPEFPSRGSSCSSSKNVENPYIGLNAIDVIISEYWEELKKNPKFINIILEKIPLQYLCGLYMRFKTDDLSWEIISGRISKTKQDELYTYWNGFKQPISSWRTGQTTSYQKFIARLKQAKSTFDKAEEVIKYYYSAPLRKDVQKLSECDPNNERQLEMRRDVHGELHAAEALLNAEMAIMAIIGKDEILWSSLSSDLDSSDNPITEKQIELLLLAMAYHDSARLGDGHDYWDPLSAANFTKDMLNAGYDEKDVWSVATCLLKKNNKEAAQYNTIIKVINFGDALEMLRLLFINPDKLLTNTQGERITFDPDKIFLFENHKKLKENNNYFLKHCRAYVSFGNRNYLRFGGDFEFIGINLRKRIVGKYNYNPIAAENALFEKFKIKEISLKIQRRLKTSGIIVGLTAIKNFIRSASIKSDKCTYENIKVIPRFEYLHNKTLVKAIADKIFNLCVTRFSQEEKAQSTSNIQAITTVTTATTIPDQVNFEFIKKIFNGDCDEYCLAIRLVADLNREEKHIKLPHVASNAMYRQANKFNAAQLIPATIIARGSHNNVFTTDASPNKKAYCVFLTREKDLYAFYGTNIASNTRFFEIIKSPAFFCGLHSGHTFKDIDSHFKKTCGKADKANVADPANIYGKVNNEALLMPYPRVVAIGVDVDEHGLPTNPEQCFEALKLAELCAKYAEKNKKIIILGNHKKGLNQLNLSTLVEKTGLQYFNYLVTSLMSKFSEVTGNLKLSLNQNKIQEFHEQVKTLIAQIILAANKKCSELNIDNDANFAFAFLSDTDISQAIFSNLGDLIFDAISSKDVKPEGLLELLKYCSSETLYELNKSKDTENHIRNLIHLTIKSLQPEKSVILFEKAPLLLARANHAGYPEVNCIFEYLIRDAALCKQWQLLFKIITKYTEEIRLSYNENRNIEIHQESEKYGKLYVVDPNSLLSIPKEIISSALRGVFFYAESDNEIKSLSERFDLINLILAMENMTLSLSDDDADKILSIYRKANKFDWKNLHAFLARYADQLNREQISSIDNTSQPSLLNIVAESQTTESQKIFETLLRQMLDACHKCYADKLISEQLHTTLRIAVNTAQPEKIDALLKYYIQYGVHIPVDIINKANSSANTGMAFLSDYKNSVYKNIASLFENAKPKINASINTSATITKFLV